MSYRRAWLHAVNAGERLRLLPLLSRLPQPKAPRKRARKWPEALDAFLAKLFGCGVCSMHSPGCAATNCPRSISKE